MSIPPGTRLGHYEILDLIGRGGMGEVYRAHDTILARDVALKVLPEAFAREPDRVARFKREARLLASLNHTNIAAIYGLEEDKGTHFLVMELVLGDTLRDQIARDGPTPLEEALTIAKQIAEALEAAHEKPIIHRDLKPANIKVTPEGKVKVLDFGLAKAFAESESQTDIENAPTLTASPTIPGAILGTPAYMSPEQAKGKKADKRTDIWALGCILYELLTGKQAFQGENVTEVLAAILRGEPEWQALPENTPVAVRTLLRHCLEKDTKRRFRDAADLVIEIEEAQATPIAVGTLEGKARVAWRPMMVVGLACLLLGSLLTGLGFWSLRPSAGTGTVARFTVAFPQGERLAGLDLSAVAFSPDGTQLAYVVNRGGTQQLLVRAMHSPEATPLPGTEGAVSPFFSPDGKWLGFFADDKLKKVSITGGAPVVLAPVTSTSRGGSWGSDGQIIFSPENVVGLSRVSASGGAVEPLTTLDSKRGEGSHRFAHHLPGGKGLLLTVGTGGSWDEARIEVLRLDTGERKVLIEGGSDARYVATGHLVYMRAGSIMAAPFDLDRLEVTGSPVPVVEGVIQSTNNNGSLQASISDLGWLVYVPGGSEVLDRRLVWVDRKGTEQAIALPPRPYTAPRLSPDGLRLALGTDEGNRADVWVFNIGRGTLTRLTFGGSNLAPIWTPEARRVTFSSDQAGPQNLFWKLADGTGTEERLTTSERGQLAGSWSPDGQVLAYEENHPATGRDIWVLRLKEDRKAQPFVQTPFIQRTPAFSPDGRWLAYISNESGRYEVYAQPFPGPGERWQMSTEGGAEPVWNPNGRELFYRNGDKLMAVEITTRPTFRAAKPELLFEAPYWRQPSFNTTYDIAPDGRRFVMVKVSEQVAAVTQFNIVLNWFEELKRRVPAAQ